MLGKLRRNKIEITNCIYRGRQESVVCVYHDETQRKITTLCRHERVKKVTTHEIKTYR